MGRTENPDSKLACLQHGMCPASSTQHHQFGNPRLASSLPYSLIALYYVKQRCSWPEAAVVRASTSIALVQSE